MVLSPSIKVDANPRQLFRTFWTRVMANNSNGLTIKDLALILLLFAVIALLLRR